MDFENIKTASDIVWFYLSGLTNHLSPDSN